MTYTLIVIVILLALVLLITFLGRRGAMRQLASLLLVGLCALIAMVCLKRLLQLDPQYVLGGIHYTPAWAALWDKRLAERFALMAGPLSVLAFAFAAGVSLAVATLVRRLVRTWAPHAREATPQNAA